MVSPISTIRRTARTKLHLSPFRPSCLTGTALSPATGERAGEFLSNRLVTATTRAGGKMLLRPCKPLPPVHKPPPCSVSPRSLVGWASAHADQCVGKRQHGLKPILPAEKEPKRYMPNRLEADLLSEPRDGPCSRPPPFRETACLSWDVATYLWGYVFLRKR